MSETVVEAHPTPLMEAMEENLLGHVSFVQERLHGMTVDRRDALAVVDSGFCSDTFNKVLACRLTAEAPVFRRRGLGMALTWKVLEEGRRLGAAHGALQAPDEGRPVYERLGFQANGYFVEYGLG